MPLELGFCSEDDKNVVDAVFVLALEVRVTEVHLDHIKVFENQVRMFRFANLALVVFFSDMRFQVVQVEETFVAKLVSGGLPGRVGGR